MVDLGTENISWKTIFVMFLSTGLRVGELVALQWNDIDFENNTISINKTLVYYKHADGKCKYEMHEPKTSNGYREIPMMNSLKELILEYKQYLKRENIRCRVNVGNFHNFVFVNESGLPYNQQNLNRMLKRLIKKHNEKAVCSEDTEFLPNFSCHCLRHTFATRFCENDCNYKKLQYLLGQRDMQTTLNLYAHGSIEATIDSMAELEIYMFKGRK